MTLLPFIDLVTTKRPECKNDWCDNLAERRRSGTFYEVCNTCRRSEPVVRRALAPLQAELLEKTALIRELKGDKQDLTGNVKTLTDRVTALTSERDKALMRHDNEVDKRREADAALSQLRADLQEAQKVAERLRANPQGRAARVIEGLESEVARLRKEVAAMRKSRDFSVTESRIRHQKVCEQEATIDHQKARISELQRVLREQETEIENWRKKAMSAEDARSDVRVWRAKVKGLEDEVTRMNGQLSSLAKQSLSYKKKLEAEVDVVAELTKDLADQRDLNKKNVDEYTKQTNLLKLDHRTDMRKMGGALLFASLMALGLALKLKFGL